MARLGKRILQVLLGLFLFAAVYYVVPYFWDAFQDDEVLITVSPATTSIEKPLRSDGYVDYYTAVEQRASSGVTPENNGVVVLWEVFGPDEIPPQVRDKYFGMLGVKTPEPSAKDLQDWSALIKADDKLWPAVHDAYQRLVEVQQKDVEQDEGQVEQQTTEEEIEEEQPSEFPPAHAFLESVEHLSEWACVNLWTPSEFPQGDAWLARNEQRIAQLIAGSRRSEFYSPLAQKTSDEPLMMIDEYGSTHLNAISNVLRHYAMAKLRDGENEAALEAILALVRWARLSSRGSSLTPWILSDPLEEQAYATLAAAACAGKLSSQQLEKIQRDIAALPDRVSYAQFLERYDRLQTLDHYSQIARQGFDYTEPKDKPATTIDRISQRRARRRMDWNEILTNSNILLDCHIQQLDDSTAAEKQTASQRYRQLYDQLEADKNDLYVMLLLRSGTPNRVAQRRVQAMLLLNADLYVGILHGKRGLRETCLEVLQVAIAICKYRADHGSYPNDLAALYPHYWPDKQPLDRTFNSGPFKYLREGGEFVLYSFGENGRDDNANDFRAPRFKGDDVVFRSEPAKLQVVD